MVIKFYPHLMVNKYIKYHIYFSIIVILKKT